MCIFVLRALTLAKIVYEISKSFDFIEIKVILSDFKLKKSIQCVGDLAKFVHLGAYQLKYLFIKRSLNFIRCLLIQLVKYARFYGITYLILQSDV